MESESLGLKGNKAGLTAKLVGFAKRECEYDLRG